MTDRGVGTGDGVVASNGGEWQRQGGGGWMVLFVETCCTFETYTLTTLLYANSLNFISCYR